MAHSRAAERYARAVMEIAREENSLDTVEQDFHTLRYAIQNSRDLQSLLASPVFDVRVKEKLLGNIFDDKVGSIVGRFLKLLAQKGRSADLPDVVTAFTSLMDRQRGVSEATITTAVAMDAKQQSDIVARLETMSGKKLRTVYEVDPSLVGGFKARFEDRMIDGSVRHQLDRLRESLIEGTAA